jgi:hypothetical protein
MKIVLTAASTFHRLLATLMALGCVAAFGCLPPPLSTECRRFYELSPEQRQAKLRASQITEQVTLYECGMYQEPPTDYAVDVAEGGEKIIPPLLDRLKTESSETREDFLIHIFEELALKGHLRGRRDVADRLERAVSGMKDNDIKRRSQQRVKVIQDNL